MSQADAAPITGEPFVTGGKSAFATASIVHLDDYRPRRADVPPFDPCNPRHVEAWETMWRFGVIELRSQEGRP
jgi:hypothetical protein